MFQNLIRDIHWLDEVKGHTTTTLQQIQQKKKHERLCTIITTHIDLHTWNYYESFLEFSLLILLLYNWFKSTHSTKKNKKERESERITNNLWFLCWRCIICYLIIVVAKSDYENILASTWNSFDSSLFLAKHSIRWNQLLNLSKKKLIAIATHKLNFIHTYFLSFASK